mmetsp:Transcript_49259/g.114159  ORF Transcript_49259/g.114159 Transcript_49259/m.114159 type:complete len:206 (+) Transcript_49259:105-722(+)
MASAPSAPRPLCTRQPSTPTTFLRSESQGHGEQGGSVLRGQRLPEGWTGGRQRDLRRLEHVRPRWCGLPRNSRGPERSGSFAVDVLLVLQPRSRQVALCSWCQLRRLRHQRHHGLARRLSQWVSDDSARAPQPRLADECHRRGRLDSSPRCLLHGPAQRCRAVDAQRCRSHSTEPQRPSTCRPHQRCLASRGNHRLCRAPTAARA